MDISGQIESLPEFASLATKYSCVLFFPHIEHFPLSLRSGISAQCIIVSMKLRSHSCGLMT